MIWSFQDAGTMRSESETSCGEVGRHGHFDICLAASDAPFKYKRQLKTLAFREKAKIIRTLLRKNKI